MFKKIAATISAVGFVMLAVALAPGVPTVLATVGATTANDDTKLNNSRLHSSPVPLSRLGFLIRLADNRMPRRLRGRRSI
jgi:hypothetical protein